MSEWRQFYTRQQCVVCKEYGLFYIETAVPVCSDCATLSKHQSGIETETRPSETLYNGTPGDDLEP